MWNDQSNCKCLLNDVWLKNKQMAALCVVTEQLALFLDFVIPCRDISCRVTVYIGELNIENNKWMILWLFSTNDIKWKKNNCFYFKLNSKIKKMFELIGLRKLNES